MAWMFAMQNSRSSATKSKKKKKIITAPAKAAGDETATWAPNALNKNQSFPHVLCANQVRYQSRSKLLLLSKCNSMRISNLNLKSASIQLLP